MVWVTREEHSKELARILLAYFAPRGFLQLISRARSEIMEDALEPEEVPCEPAQR